MQLWCNYTAQSFAHVSHTSNSVLLTVLILDLGTGRSRLWSSNTAGWLWRCLCTCLSSLFTTTLCLLWLLWVQFYFRRNVGWFFHLSSSNFYFFCPPPSHIHKVCLLNICLKFWWIIDSVCLCLIATLLSPLFLFTSDLFYSLYSYTDFGTIPMRFIFWLGWDLVLSVGRVR